MSSPSDPLLLPATVSVLVSCPVCGEGAVVTAVLLSVRMVRAFGEGRLTVSSRAGRFDHDCGQTTLDGAVLLESARRPELLPPSPDEPAPAPVRIPRPTRRRSPVRMH